MICPLLTAGMYADPTVQGDTTVECYEEKCTWWNSKANFNPDTKQFEGQCCILTLSRLKVSGGINTHPY